MTDTTNALTDERILEVFEREMFAEDQRGLFKEHAESGAAILRAFRALLSAAPELDQHHSCAREPAEEGQSAITQAERVDSLLSKAQDDYTYGGSEDSDGTLHPGSVDWRRLRSTIRAIITKGQP